MRKARQTELDYAGKKRVWTKVTREEARRKGWRIIKTRWTDINKGDERRPS